MSAGVSGDMILGGLFALGFDPEILNAVLRETKLPASVYSETVMVHGVKSMRVRVLCLEANPPHRGLKDFLSLLEKNRLPPAVEKTAENIFRRLAEAEAEIHGIPIEEVHFHEIGGLDTFVDVLGAVLGMQHLGVEKCLATPFPFGRGSLKIAHGVLPEPAPATLLLTRGFPSFRTGWEGEHCTPTGAAIVTTVAQPVTPEWTSILNAVGQGAGSRDPVDRANVLRLCLYDETTAADAAFQMCQIECNLDNATPEQVAYAVECLFAAGCLDAWQESIVMKKGRLGVKLSALATPTLRDEAMRIIATETPAGGLRWFPVRRHVSHKKSANIDTGFGAVEAKEIVFPAWGLQRVQPEYESLRTTAKEKSVPLRKVQEAATESMRNKKGKT